MPISLYARLGQTTVTGIQTTRRQHVIHGGETLSSIAADEYQEGYNSEHWRQIAEANGITDLDALTVGQVLVIPAIAPTST